MTDDAAQRSGGRPCGSRADLARPSIIQRAGAASAARTIKAVMHGDLRVLDPIWTTANITAYHGAMIYDTLFGLDANFEPQPQMVDKWGVSDDKLTYTFELRDGLKFSDGAAVTAADCVASVRRWAARDGAGQHMLQRVKDTPVVDDKTFQIVLNEPYGLVIDALAKTSTSLCFMMRKKDAETDPNQQVRETIGSGPFLFNRDETRPGNRHVYDRNPNYVPRPSRPPAWPAARWSSSTASSSRTSPTSRPRSRAAGRRDRLLRGPAAGPARRARRRTRTSRSQVLNKPGHVGFMRLNFLHPPFNNVEARQAHAAPRQAGRRDARDLRPVEIRGRPAAPISPAARRWRTTPTPTGSRTARTSPRRRSCSRRPATTASRSSCCRRPTHYMNNPAGLFAAQWLRQAGFNVELAATDWGALVHAPRRQEAAGRGRLEHLLHHRRPASRFADPIAFAGHAANGDKAWFGWPTNELQEKLRDKWATAPTLDERKAVARELQENAWNFVPHVYLGQWLQLGVAQTSRRDAMPEVIRSGTSRRRELVRIAARRPASALRGRHARTDGALERRLPSMTRLHRPPPASTVLVMAIVAVFVFLLLHLSPGDPAAIIAGDNATARADRRRSASQLGLDDPLPVQFFRWVAAVLQGDLGISIFSNEPVAQADQPARRADALARAHHADRRGDARGHVRRARGLEGRHLDRPRRDGASRCSASRCRCSSSATC